MAVVVTKIIPASVPNTKAVAVVDMGDGTEQQIAFWPELVAQWTGDPMVPGTPMGDYIIACGLWAAGQYDAAHAALQPHVQPGNWADEWIKQHPVPAPYTAPVPY